MADCQDAQVPGAGNRCHSAGRGLLHSRQPVRTANATATAARLPAPPSPTQIFFFSAYARTLGYSTAAGANFIALSNACNAVGKIIIGLLADRYGRLNALLAATLVSALASVALWLPSTFLASRGFFLAYVILYGVFASAYVSLFPSVTLEVFGPAQFPAVYSTLYQMRGLATFVGTPVAGALVRGAGGGGTGSAGGSEAYWGTVVMVSGLLCAATVSLGWARVEAAKGPERGWKK